MLRRFFNLLLLRSRTALKIYRPYSVLIALLLLEIVHKYLQLSFNLLDEMRSVRRLRFGNVEPLAMVSIYHLHSWLNSINLILFYSYSVHQPWNPLISTVSLVKNFDNREIWFNSFISLIFLILHSVRWIKIRFCFVCADPTDMGPDWTLG